MKEFANGLLEGSSLRKQEGPSPKAIQTRIISQTKRLAALTVVLAAAFVTVAIAAEPKTVPFKYTGAGQINPTLTEAFGTGVGYHIGLYDSHVWTDATGGWEELTAANQDTLLAQVQVVNVYFDENGFLVMEYSAEIVGGSGRFQYAMGQYSGKVVIDLNTLGLTAEASGCIATVGSTK